MLVAFPVSGEWFLIFHNGIPGSAGNAFTTG